MARSKNLEQTTLSVKDFGPIAEANIELQSAHRISWRKQHRQVLLGHLAVRASPVLRPTWPKVVSISAR